MDKISVIILAGGKSTRMGGNTPKVLLNLQTKPIIIWDLILLQELGVLDETVCVTGYQANEIENVIKSFGFAINFAHQGSKGGTAAATKAAIKYVSEQNTLVLYADDSALYKRKTVEQLVASHLRSQRPLTILSSVLPLISSIGGLGRNQSGEIIEVLTKKQLEDKGLRKAEILCGAFCFKTQWLRENLPKIKPSLVSGEYPLTGLIPIAASQRNFPNSFRLADALEWNSVNTAEELAEADKKKGKILNG